MNQSSTTADVAGIHHHFPGKADLVAALEVRACFRFLSGWLAAVLERGVREGALTLAHAPRVEAEAFMAIVQGAMLSARAHGDAQTFCAIKWPQLERFAARKVND